MTTVTLPREVVQKAELLLGRYLKETPLGNQPHMIALEAEIAVENLRAALDAPATVNCRGCAHLKEKVISCSVDNFSAEFKTIARCDGPETCTDFDKFQALPPISLTNITKVTK